MFCRKMYIVYFLSNLLDMLLSHILSHLVIKSCSRFCHLLKLSLLVLFLFCHNFVKIVHCLLSVKFARYAFVPYFVTSCHQVLFTFLSFVEVVSSSFVPILSQFRQKLSIVCLLSNLLDMLLSHFCFLFCLVLTWSCFSWSFGKFYPHFIHWYL